MSGRGPAAKLCVYTRVPWRGLQGMGSSNPEPPLLRRERASDVDQIGSKPREESIQSVRLVIMSAY